MQIFSPFDIRYFAYSLMNVVLPDPRNPVIRSIFTIALSVLVEYKCLVTYSVHTSAKVYLTTFSISFTATSTW